MKYTCLIVDDEPLAILVIKKHLENFPQIEILSECGNALEALDMLRKQKTDLLFLDIQMPQVNGMEMIKSLVRRPDIILTTAYREFAAEAFDLDVLDFLVKPISLERFLKAVGRFLDNKRVKLSDNNPPDRETSDYVFVKSENKLVKIEFCNLQYIESMGDYVTIHTTVGKVVTKDKISHLSETLSSAEFMRVHKGFIVSVRHIKAIWPGCLEVGTVKIPIGRNYKSEVLTKLKM